MTAGEKDAIAICLEMSPMPDPGRASKLVTCASGSVTQAFRASVVQHR